MPKSRLTLERVTGVVALSYLILIPVTSIIAYQKLRELDRDLTTLWDFVGIDEPQTTAPVVSLDRIRKVFRK